MRRITGFVATYAGPDGRTLTADQWAAAPAVFNATLGITSGRGSLLDPGETALQL